jgi:hypothetical protein
MDFFSSEPIPAKGSVIMSDLMHYQLTSTWTASAVAVTFDQAPAAGHLRIYLTTEVVQVASS